MRGIHGTVVHARMTYMSCATTAGLGSLAASMVVLVFLLAPRGAASIVCAATLTALVTFFHFSSTLWGMEYVNNRPGLAWGPVMEEGMVLIFVLVQVCV